MSGRRETALATFLTAFIAAEPWQRDIALAQMRGMAERDAAIKRDVGLFTLPDEWRPKRIRRTA